MGDIERLSAAIKTVADIYGVSIGSKLDKSTWRVDFRDGVTPEQIAAANAIVAAFVVSTIAEIAEAEAERLMLEESREKVLEYLEEKEAGITTTMTKAQFDTLAAQRKAAKVNRRREGS